MTVRIILSLIFLFSHATVCPNGITNITASSGSLIYPSSGDYGVNETKCWKIEAPDTYAGVGWHFNR